jgi:aryl-alcohol dehydrogenase-like predicted oxidoreductase
MLPGRWHMETRRLGSDGPDLTVAGLGCNNFGMRLGEEQTRAVIGAALEAGINHFDTAEMYGGGKSEEFIGRALAGRRDDVVIASKFLPRLNDEPYTSGALRRRVLEGCEISLRRLQTDHIDLYYQHYPDRHAPVDEALEALSDLVDEGKVLHVACSNYSGAQLEAASAVGGRHRFCGVQIEWSLLKQATAADVAPAANRTGVGIVPYFPLASGLLTGKYTKGRDFPEGTRLAASSYFAADATDENFDYIDTLAAFAAERGHTLLELAVSWLLAQDGVASVITGATSAEQVRANASATSWKLEPEELAAVPTPPGR